MAPAAPRSRRGGWRRRRGSGRPGDSTPAAGREDDGGDRSSAAAASTDAAADDDKPGTDRSDAAKDPEAHAGADAGTPTPVECCKAAESRAADSRQGAPLADYN